MSRLVNERRIWKIAHNKYFNSARCSAAPHSIRLKIAMVFKRLLSGFILSVPVSLLICIGFANETEPTSWILWGIAYLLGLPTNILIFGVFYAVFDSAINFLPSLSAGTGWYIIACLFIFPAIIGSHLNGILISLFIYKNKKSPNLDAGPSKKTNTST